MQLATPAAEAVFHVYKPPGMSSFDVIRRLRRQLPGVKMGHAGTLDPFAEGVLIIATGAKTKRLSALQALEKEYEADICLGAVSTTFDPEGEIISIWPKFSAEQFAARKQFFPGFFPNGAAANEPAADDSAPSLTGSRLRKQGFLQLSASDIEPVLQRFVGEIEQLPPVFSAKKVGGVRAYKAARQGKALALRPKRVRVYRIELLDFAWPQLRVRVVCGSGVYIRSLGYDIGRVLGCGGYVTKLIRTRIGDYRLEDAVRLLDTL